MATITALFAILVALFLCVWYIFALNLELQRLDNFMGDVTNEGVATPSLYACPEIYSHSSFSGIGVDPEGWDSESQSGMSDSSGIYLSCQDFTGEGVSIASCDVKRGVEYVHVEGVGDCFRANLNGLDFAGSKTRLTLKVFFNFAGVINITSSNTSSSNARLVDTYAKTVSLYLVPAEENPAVEMRYLRQNAEDRIRSHLNVCGVTSIIVDAAQTRESKLLDWFLGIETNEMRRLIKTTTASSLYIAGKAYNESIGFTEHEPAFDQDTQCIYQSISFTAGEKRMEVYSASWFTFVAVVGGMLSISRLIFNFFLRRRNQLADYTLRGMEATNVVISRILDAVDSVDSEDILSEVRASAENSQKMMTSYETMLFRLQIIRKAAKKLEERNLPLLDSIDAILMTADLIAQTKTYLERLNMKIETSQTAHFRRLAECVRVDVVVHGAMQLLTTTSRYMVLQLIHAGQSVLHAKIEHSKQKSLEKDEDNASSLDE
eukprot:gene12122-14325_t